MKQAAILSAFETYLRQRKLRLTPQRRRIFDRAFATHEHFSAETLFGWLRGEEGPKVSRATVYRTLSLLQDGGFIDSLDTGRGELVYEHVLGHHHHDHMVCLKCGRIEEFRDDRIEELQVEACKQKGFDLVNHSLVLQGYCRTCRRDVPTADRAAVRAALRDADSSS